MSGPSNIDSVFKYLSGLMLLWMMGLIFALLFSDDFDPTIMVLMWGWTLIGTVSLTLVYLLLKCTLDRSEKKKL